MEGGHRINQLMNSIGYNIITTTTIIPVVSWNGMETLWTLLRCLYQLLLLLCQLSQCTTNIYNNRSKNGMLEVIWSKVVCSLCRKGTKMLVWIRITKLTKWNLLMLSEKLLLRNRGRDSITYIRRRNEIRLAEGLGD